MIIRSIISLYFWLLLLAALAFYDTLVFEYSVIRVERYKHGDVVPPYLISVENGPPCTFGVDAKAVFYSNNTQEIYPDSSKKYVSLIFCDIEGRKDVTVNEHWTALYQSPRGDYVIDGWKQDDRGSR